jgi:hypothetical protein
MDECEEQGGGQREVRHRKSLSDRDRYAAYVAMHTLCMRNGGKFKRSDKKGVAEFFKADLQIIQRIWKMAMRQIAQGLEVDVSNKRKRRCGRKPIKIDLSGVPTIPLNQRSTIRSLAWQLGVSPTTLFIRFTMNLLRRQSNSLKPALKEKNKKERLEFCISMINERTREDAVPKFLIEKVLPAVVAAWPVEDVGKTILIQQDNATPHILSANSGSNCGKNWINHKADSTAGK